MNHDFQLMKTIALDPFARDAIPAVPPAMREWRASLNPDVVCQIANGPWSEAECCCDPGPDEFPEIEALGVREGSR